MVQFIIKIARCLQITSVIWLSKLALFILFCFVNDHLDEPVEMLSFPPSIFGSRILALFAVTFVIHVLAS